jgi:hypothetical protein
VQVLAHATRLDVDERGGDRFGDREVDTIPDEPRAYRPVPQAR